MKNGFTLAEVLITLAVIGVVAALTIPTLIQSYQEKATVTKLKKVYSVLSQAFTMAVANNGQPENWGVYADYVKNDDESINKEESKKLMQEKSVLLANIMIPYLKTMKVCYVESGCWYNDNVYALNGEVWDSAERTDLAKVILNDGTILAFGGKLSGNIPGWILVDINGSKKPNKYGIDVFEFDILNKGLQPYGIQGDILFPFKSACAKGYNSNGHGCTAWVIYNENMDYLHCDDLSWDGKHKCD